MMKKLVVCTGVAAAALIVACSESARTPVSPSATPVARSASHGGAETLKVAPSAPMDPPDGQEISDTSFSLVVTNAEATYVEGVAFTYRFQVFDADNTLVDEADGVAQGAGGLTSHLVTASFDPGTYTWWARAEIGEDFGPWSDTSTFVIPEAVSDGYIHGNELYDPLTSCNPDGSVKTIGTVHGLVTCVPGVGAKLENQLSYISYQLDATLTQGEFSILATGLRTNTEGGKTKLFAMAEGYSDLVVNERRMTVEKRGDPPGVIAWRFISHEDQIDTVGAERVMREFNQKQTYFWKATWRNQFFKVRVREGGANGVIIYDFGKPYAGAYDPNPHVIYLGAPVGRSGVDGASVDGAIIRQVWVSNRPRPPFANQ